MSGKSQSWWRGALLSQLARSSGSAAVLFLVLDDGTETFTFPRLNWLIVLIASISVIGLAVLIAIAVSSAHFDEPSTPNPPATCSLFCPTPT
ncbi:hypothetical protein GFY24_17470 [Nocardia sp. SYP-A9097]|uniref:hypothetical protein n=1 Tax=Nocardia sp. SYP-A9097 TaxID=2663237 RepID=UPI00129BD355|nr:hypothetical protein [Nocardia sp. SYP-A9097]MRH89216.1 hypothetical protein [Nocardia sp. SYP-A9097]